MERERRGDRQTGMQTDTQTGMHTHRCTESQRQRLRHREGGRRG